MLGLLGWKGKRERGGGNRYNLVGTNVSNFAQVRLAAASANDDETELCSSSFLVQLGFLNRIKLNQSKLRIFSVNFPTDSIE